MYSKENFIQSIERKAVKNFIDEYGTEQEIQVRLEKFECENENFELVEMYVISEVHEEIESGSEEYVDEIFTTSLRQAKKHFNNMVQVLV